MGFLSSMLPMIAGGALAATGVGAPAAAAMIGGLQYARTGSLQKGLMAGLGAYGGAGIGSNLAAMGESAAADVAAKAVPQTNLTGIDALDAQTGALQDYNTAMQTAREAAIKQAQATPFETMGKGISAAFQNPSQFANTMTGKEAMQYGLAAAAPALTTTTQQPQMPVGDSAMPQRLKYTQGTATPFPQPDVPGYDNLGQDFGRQQNFFPKAGYQQITPEEAKSIRGYATGGYMGGGPVEAMSNANAVGENTGYPQADITGHAYATPWQTPISQNVVSGEADTGVNRMTGDMLAEGGIADAQYNLGSYSDGGRLLRGPGDGVSDSIPAVIGHKKPARLADGEFVVPARIVSELGNGSTDAGARKLYAMLDRVQAARKKSIGKGKVAHNSRADKYLPA
jgi:hypothetical protein